MNFRRSIKALLSARNPESINKFAAPLFMALAMLFAGTANAATITKWQVTVDSTFVPGSIVDSEGNTPGDVTISNGDRSLRWGDDDESGLDITNSPVDTEVDTSIGFPLNAPVANVSITHFNNPIQPPTLDSVTLMNSITLTALEPPPPGTPQSDISLDFMIDFQETTNNDDPCDDGGANGVGVNVDGCGDIFVMSDDALNYEFDYEGQTYFISFVEVTGGLQSLSAEACEAATGSSDPCLGFVTPEGADTTFSFGAIISTDELVIDPPPGTVPAPGALGLVGLGLVTLAGIRRRRNLA